MNNNDKSIKNLLNQDLKIPQSFYASINFTLDQLPDKKNNSKNLNKIKFTFATTFCSIFLITGVVFAKDIEIFFKSFFNNSNKAIDVAVENGYIQTEEMDYTYDKNIGIKVDNLVLDDLNLDISFNFKIKKENVKSIRLNNFIIKTDNEKVVFQSEFKTAQTLEELPLYDSFNWSNEPIKLTDTTFLDSILLGLRPEKEDFKELYFDIKSVDIVYTDGKREVIDGQWKFEVTINDEMRKSENVVYTLGESNDYIETCTATIANTGMVIELASKVAIPNITYEKYGAMMMDMVSLYINGKKYEARAVDFSAEYMKIDYDDIGKFIENSDKLELHLDFFNTTVILTK